MLTIHSGAPIPSAREGRRGQAASSIYQFRALAVGQHFIVDRATDPRAEKRVRNAASTASRRLGARFVVRVLPSDTRLLGVWREA